MSRDRRVAGIGGIAFAVFLTVTLAYAGTKGGEYTAASVAAIVDQSLTTILISFFLIAISIIGLVVLMAYLSETGFGADRLGRVAWGTGLLGAASLLIGWVLQFAPSVSLSGGVPALDPAISMTFIYAGYAVFFAAGGMLLGIAILTLAIGGHAVPMWVRAFSALAGLIGLLSIANIPFYPMLLWGLVVGIWLLVSSPRPDAPTTATPQTT
jgi:hypothetical protein